VLGGFSMGTVMSYALGLAPDRPAPAGILAFSGFVPTVDGWTPDVAGRAAAGTRAFVAHGRRDQVIDVSFGRAARALLEAGGVAVEYHESDAVHQIDPAHVAPAQDWLAATLAT
jgi:phospholipase/carboxylesterase